MFLEGGCECGAVRYRLGAEPFDAAYCHCTMCRRSAGAPVLAFASVPFLAFTLTRGVPKKRHSSAVAERWFCGNCGAQLVMRMDDQPDTIDFTLASLDHPEEVVPMYHIWFGNRVRWFDTTDTHPRHRKSRPQTEDV